MIACTGKSAAFIEGLAGKTVLASNRYMDLTASAFCAPDLGFTKEATANPLTPMLVINDQGCNKCYRFTHIMRLMLLKKYCTYYLIIQLGNQTGHLFMTLQHGEPLL